MTVRKVPTAEFPTINDALVVSAPYDTIRVGEGNFSEALTINIDGLRIIGAGKGKTIIDGQTLGASDGITINNQLVTIENLTVQNFKGTGIFVNFQNNIVHKVQVINNEIGIELNNGSRNMVFECDINGNVGDGIISRRGNTFIMHCKLINNKSNGLLVESNVSKNLIFCCVAEQNTKNGFFVGGRLCYVFSNAAIKNGDNGFSDSITSFENIYAFNKSLDNMMNGFLIDSEVTLFDNVSKNNVLNGISAMNGVTRIIKNHVSNNKKAGIQVGSNENVIDRNFVKNNKEAGVHIAGDETAVRSNCIRGNNPDILLEESIMDSTFAENDCETSIPQGLCEENDIINVQKGKSIQQAVNGAEDGFQINVNEGIFHEQVNIPISKQRLRIVGSGRCKTILDGTNIEGDGITISSRLNSLENLTVQNFGVNGVNIEEDFNTLEKIQSKNNIEDGFMITEDVSFFNHCEAIMNGRNGFNGEDTNYFIKCKANKNQSHGFIVVDCNIFLFNEAKNNILNGFSFNDEHICIENCAIDNRANGFLSRFDDNLWFLNKAIGNSLNGIEVNEIDHIIWGNVCNKNQSNGVELTGFNNRVLKNICQMNKDNGIKVIEILQPEVNTIIDQNCIENNGEAGIIIEDSTIDFFGIRSNCLSGNNPDIQNNSLEDNNMSIDENKCNTSIPDGLCEGICELKKFYKR
ncbi:right-handed parallel beta-helix repeat-containing protein [Chengkuizengella sp. SCS-71B]|uniref:right-handed parallel beta-helix repeat-containing protein n=1 Tax=Chengkuizengella sp. SCS-71B TaxID=3115290 RepID=UPI0032C2451B